MIRVLHQLDQRTAAGGGIEKRDAAAVRTRAGASCRGPGHRPRSAPRADRRALRPRTRRGARRSRRERSPQRHASPRAPARRTRAARRRPYPQDVRPSSASGSGPLHLGAEPVAEQGGRGLELRDDDPDVRESAQRRDRPRGAHVSDAGAKCAMSVIAPVRSSRHTARTRAPGPRLLGSVVETVQQRVAGAIDPDQPEHRRAGKVVRHGGQASITPSGGISRVSRRCVPSGANGDGRHGHVPAALGADQPALAAARSAPSRCIAPRCRRTAGRSSGRRRARSSVDHPEVADVGEAIRFAPHAA